MTAPLFDTALTFALERHRGQARKETHVPYITHPVAVAETLAYHYPERLELVIAGLLHDVVEDTETPLDEVAARFGDGVARRVAAVTKPPPAAGLPEEKRARWLAQRRAMLEHLEGAGLEGDGDSSRSRDEQADVLRLKAADALANLRAIARDLAHPDVGEAVWARFKVGREESLWFYREILTRVRAGLGDEPLALELERELARVEAS